MKKISFIFAGIFILISSYALGEEKNCENKALINKLYCKMTGSKSGDDNNKGISSLKPDFTNFKDKKYLSDFFKKKN